VKHASRALTDSGDACRPTTHGDGAECSAVQRRYSGYGKTRGHEKKQNMLRQRCMYVCAITRSMHRAGPATCTKPGPPVCTEASTANRSRTVHRLSCALGICGGEAWLRRLRRYSICSPFELGTLRMRPSPRSGQVMLSRHHAMVAPLRLSLEFHLALKGQDAPLCTTSRRGPQDP
jgi:hypothetical protein